MLASVNVKYRPRFREAGFQQVATICSYLPFDILLLGLQTLR